MYMTWILDGRYRAPGWLAWIESRVDSGSQSWKQYAYALVSFNIFLFVVGFIILGTQQWQPAFLNPDNKGALAPSTIFHTACSFLTNTNQQHYSGEQHLSYGTQLFFICWKQFVTPAIGLAVFAAILRALRGDANVGNFFLDTWRGVVYILVPLSLIVGVILVANGVPMTMEPAAEATIVQPDKDGNPQTQKIARGPVAAIVSIKQLGTNGGGYFGPNSAHPYENPTAWSNIVENVCILLLPMACVVMFGVMLQQQRQAIVIGCLLLLLLVGMIVWGIAFDTQRGNPAFADLPVDQSQGNLEGKEVRFGTSAGPTWAAATTATSNGSVNCMHDSLNPLAQLAPFFGMWLNCVFGGIGVGFINLFVYIITAVFLAGLMVGRTPEYMGKKIEAREMKLAMLALLIHPLLVLVPTGVFIACDWGEKAASNPGAHGFSQTLYEFTSASANNGSGFEGLGDTYGAADNENPAKYAIPWDIACGIVLIQGRFVPMIAPLALAGGLAQKKRVPFTSGTLRTDTVTFGGLLLGTIILVGALLFLPSAVLGPIAEHLAILFGK